MEAKDFTWDYNCPKFVDFSALPTEDDGADQWFDIHSETEDVFPMSGAYNTQFNKENKIKLHTPKKPSLTAKRVSIENVKRSSLDKKHGSKQKVKRISVGDKKYERRSVPLRVLVKNEAASSVSNIIENMNKMSLKTLPPLMPKERTKNINRFSLPKKIEKTETKTRVDDDGKYFIASLRNNTNKATKMLNEGLLVTKPQPFNLTESKREKVNQPAFRSMAEQVIAFQKQTPSRFRTQRRRSSNFKPQIGKVVPLKATIPITPNLQTKSRSRPTTAISRDEEEKLELNEIRKNTFKHKPVDSKMFIEKPVIKKVEVKITKPKPFNLTAPKPKVKRSVSLENFKTEFKAKPVPAGLFEGPKGLGAYKEIPLTNPKSPLFASSRIRNERRRSNSVDGNFAVPQPKFITPKTSSGGIPNIKWEKKSTRIEPFSFDDKDKERFTRKDEKIKEIVEQEKKWAEFHAHPMPDLTTVKIPEKNVRPATEIVPFKFIRDNLGTSRTEKFKKEMEEELEKQREMAKFKAGPNKVIYEPPFIPDKSNRKLTDVSNFDLHTEIRSVERIEYDESVKQKEARIEAQRKELEFKLQEEERLRLLELRKNAVPKANPVRHYKPINVKPSNVPLTLPLTPNFCLKKN